MSKNNNLNNKVPKGVGYAPEASPLTGTVKSKIGSASDSRSLGFAGFGGSKGLSFGSPSDKNSNGQSQTAGNQWESLLKQTASGGISNLLGGGGLGSILGLGGILSGFASLFGGGKQSAPPLQRFALPATDDQTVYLGSSGSAVYSGVVTEGSTTSNPSTGTYMASQTLAATSNRAAEVAQAVKVALLNSSSLGDVIGDL